MRNVVCPRAPELRTLWIRTRELGISLRSWRPRYHGGPPMVKYGPKDTDVTPVVPRYYSPGLPNAHSSPLDCSLVKFATLEKKWRDRLIALAAPHADWGLGFQDEVWWSRLAQPTLHPWPDDKP